ncbi:MAG: hypothetical protein ACREPE_04935 [Lysobacter sp.]
MNRKLHHTLKGLMTSAALVLGLAAASPATLPGADLTAAPSGYTAADSNGFDAAALSREAAIAAHVEAVAVQIDTNAAPSAAVQKSRHASGKSRRIRQSMAMPFFSFAPRG